MTENKLKQKKKMARQVGSQSLIDLIKPNNTTVAEGVLQAGGPTSTSHKTERTQNKVISTGMVVRVYSNLTPLSSRSSTAI